MSVVVPIVIGFTSVCTVDDDVVSGLENHASAEYADPSADPEACS